MAGRKMASRRRKTGYWDRQRLRTEGNKKRRKEKHIAAHPNDLQGAGKVRPPRQFKRRARRGR